MIGTEILQKAGAAILAFTAGNTVAKNRKLCLYTGQISGIRFYGLESIYHCIGEGSILVLKRESENKFDSNAISIWFRNIKLGYVPRKDNQVLARLMDGYFEFDARVVHLEKQRYMPPEAVTFSIFRKDMGYKG